MKDWIETKD